MTCPLPAGWSVNPRPTPGWRRDLTEMPEMKKVKEMTALASRTVHLPSRRAWKVILVTIAVLAVSGTAFAVGRGTARATQPAARPLSGTTTAWANGHTSEIAWMRGHMTEMAWLRRHPAQSAWMRMHPGDVTWLQQHPAQLHWVRRHQAAWNWMQGHPAAWTWMAGTWPTSGGCTITGRSGGSGGRPAPAAAAAATPGSPELVRQLDDVPVVILHELERLYLYGEPSKRVGHRRIGRQIWPPSWTRRNAAMSVSAGPRRRSPVRTSNLLP